MLIIWIEPCRCGGVMKITSAQGRVRYLKCDTCGITDKAIVQPTEQKGPRMEFVRINTGSKEAIINRSLITRIIRDASLTRIDFAGQASIYVSGTPEEVTAAIVSAEPIGPAPERIALESHHGAAEDTVKTDSERVAAKAYRTQKGRKK